MCAETTAEVTGETSGRGREYGSSKSRSWRVRRLSLDETEPGSICLVQDDNYQPSSHGYANGYETEPPLRNVSMDGIVSTRDTMVDKECESTCHPEEAEPHFCRSKKHEKNNIRAGEMKHESIQRRCSEKFNSTRKCRPSKISDFESFKDNDLRKKSSTSTSAMYEPENDEFSCPCMHKPAACGGHKEKREGGEHQIRGRSFSVSREERTKRETVSNSLNNSRKDNRPENSQGHHDPYDCRQSDKDQCNGANSSNDDRQPEVDEFSSTNDSNGVEMSGGRDRKRRQRGRVLWSLHAEPAARAADASLRKPQTVGSESSLRSEVYASAKSNNARPYHGLYARSLQANGIDPVAFKKMPHANDRPCSECSPSCPCATSAKDHLECTDDSLLMPETRAARALIDSRPDQLEAGQVSDDCARGGRGIHFV